jgi:hypothetical protein
MTLARRLVAELLGTALLLAAVVGSGIMGEHLSGGNVAIALLANTLATGAALTTLIFTLSGTERCRGTGIPADYQSRYRLGRSARGRSPSGEWQDRGLLLDFACVGRTNVWCVTSQSKSCSFRPGNS